MRVILDTNVFISGIFFSGPPHRILKAWRDGKISLVVSPEILEEYGRVGQMLGVDFPGVDIVPFLALVAVEAEISLAPPLPERVCEHHEDDKFVACALASKCRIIVSGDKHLLKVSGYRGISVKTPRRFVQDYLQP